MCSSGSSNMLFWFFRSVGKVRLLGAVNIAGDSLNTLPNIQRRIKSTMEQLQWQMLPSKVYVILLNTAAKIGTTVVSKPIGQILLDYTDKCLWTVEKSVEWCLLPGPNSEHKDENATMSEKPEDGSTKDSEAEVVRPLPWLFFLPVIMCLRVAKTSIDVCSYMLHKESLEPTSVVEFIQTRRNQLKEIKGSLQTNQEESKIKDEPPSEVNTCSSNDKPEEKEKETTQVIPEKESPMESKTEPEVTATPPSEAESSSAAAPTLTNTDATSSPVESIESDNANDSSSTLEASLTENEDIEENTKEEDDFHSLKSSSTYFSPDSSYSHQSVSEDSKAGDITMTESENEIQDPPSLAAAIEELRALSVPEKTPTNTPRESLSSSTSSTQQPESAKKRTPFATFFQVRRKAT